MTDTLAALVAIIVAAAIAYFGGRRSKARDQKLDALTQAHKSNAAGQKAKAKARADLRAGQSPEQIVRKNDGAWQ